MYVSQGVKQRFEDYRHKAKKTNLQVVLDAITAKHEDLHDIIKKSAVSTAPVGSLFPPADPSAVRYLGGGERADRVQSHARTGKRARQHWAGSWLHHTEYMDCPPSPERLSPWPKGHLDRTELAAPSSVNDSCDVWQARDGGRRRPPDSPGGGRGSECVTAPPFR